MSDLLDHLLPRTPLLWPVPDRRHRAYFGPSGAGKTYAIMLDIRKALDDPLRAVSVTDPENDITPQILEYIAARTPWRRVHQLDPTNPSYAFGLPLLSVADPRNVQSCHDAAVRALAVFGQVLNFGEEQLGPRISKLLYTGFYALARADKPLVLLPEIYASGAATFRTALAEVFSYAFIADVWHGLERIPERTLLEYIDPVISRLLEIFGSPAMRAVFGQRREKNIDIGRIMEDGDVVLLLLGELEAGDAKLLGSAYYSILHHWALKRPLDAHRLVEVFWDEIADFLIPDLARGFDRLRKRKIFLRVALQRLSQAATADDPRQPILSAILTSARTKIVFGGMTPDDCELLARLMFGGHIELDTIYKAGSVRPVVTGQTKVQLTSRAEARHDVEQHATAISDATSASRMQAISQAFMSGTGTAFSSGNSLSLSSLPDAGFVSPATPMSRSKGLATGRASSNSTSIARARVAAQQSADSHAESNSHGRARGRSQARGTSEAYISTFQLLETESYSLDEKIAATIGLLQSLPPRACLIKIDGEAPYLVSRTPELLPAFRSQRFRELAMECFAAKITRSPYLFPRAEIETDIARALAELSPEIEEPDYAEPEPSPRLRVITNGDN